MKALTEITAWLSPHAARPSRRQRSRRGGFIRGTKINKSLLGRRQCVHTECIDLLPGMQAGRNFEWTDVKTGYLSPKWSDLLTEAPVVTARRAPQVDANGIAWLA